MEDGSGDKASIFQKQGDSRSGSGVARLTDRRHGS